MLPINTSMEEYIIKVIWFSYPWKGSGTYEKIHRAIRVLPLVSFHLVLCVIQGSLEFKIL